MYIYARLTYTDSVLYTLIGGAVMELGTIGRNIRKYRLEKKLRQEDLAERANLSINYVGAIERGEKIPALESLITIINALGVSADMILADVINTGYEIKTSMLSEKLSKLSKDDKNMAYDMIDVLLKYRKKR